MGSMTVELPIPYTQVMLNGWEILGQFMYPAHAYRRLVQLAGSGQLDLGVIEPRVYSFDDLPDAMRAAATAGSLAYVVISNS